MLVIKFINNLLPEISAICSNDYRIKLSLIIKFVNCNQRYHNDCMKNFKNIFTQILSSGFVWFCYSWTGELNAQIELTKNTTILINGHSSSDATNFTHDSNPPVPPTLHLDDDCKITKILLVLLIKITIAPTILQST